MEDLKSFLKRPVGTGLDEDGAVVVVSLLGVMGVMGVLSGVMTAGAGDLAGDSSLAGRAGMLLLAFLPLGFS